ncbi:type II secretion system protein [Methylocystis sp.]|uniref:type II secretion system protein n=1 Tax=Methylocystis sp. TaxID=1911079 RepID=UPI003DA2563D
MSTTARSERALRHRAFTLIELLVVVAIIGLLASIVTTSLGGARRKAKDARRMADLKQIHMALEMYNTDHGSYPNPGWAWRSQCNAWGAQSASDVIPGLVPQYLPSFPSDPDMNVSGNTCCYLYLSNGTDFKLLDHNCPTLNYQSVQTLIDPTRDSGSNACLVDGAGFWSLAVFTSGGCGW